MKINPISGFFIAGIGAGVFGACAANATVYQYSFEAGSYYDFGAADSNVVTGSFDYDSAADVFSDVHYDRGGTIFNVASSTGPGAGPDEIYFGDTTSQDYDVYQLANSLAVGGTDVIVAGFHPEIVIEAGGSVATDVVSSAPEPANWALMLLGFGVVGSVVRRRRETSVVS